MLLFCVNPGIAFVISFLGVNVMQSFDIGLILFSCVTLSGLAIAIFTGISLPVPKKEQHPKNFKNNNALVQSITDASSITIKMCSCVVLFSGITSILKGSGALKFINSIIGFGGFLSPFEASSISSFIIEVNGGVGTASNFHIHPAFFAFGLAFAGICVHLQVFSFFKTLPISKLKFTLFRFIHALLSYWLCVFIMGFFPNALPVFISSSTKFEIGTQASIVGGLSLLLMCVVFLLIVFSKKNHAMSKDNL